MVPAFGQTKRPDIIWGLVGFNGKLIRVPEG